MADTHNEIVRLADPRIMEIIDQCVAYTTQHQAQPKLVYSEEGTGDANEIRDTEDD